MITVAGFAVEVCKITSYNRKREKKKEEHQEQVVFPKYFYSRDEEYLKRKTKEKSIARGELAFQPAFVRQTHSHTFVVIKLMDILVN